MKSAYVFLALFICLLSSCKSTDSKPSISSEDAIKSIQEKLIQAFWRASDKTLRENTVLSGHQSKEDAFIKEHVCSIHSAEKIAETEDYKVIYRITIPEIKHAFYEFTFTGNRDQWQIIDGRTKIQDKEYNYIEGKFLGSKSLEPYLKNELIELGAPMKLEKL